MASNKKHRGNWSVKFYDSKPTPKGKGKNKTSGGIEECTEKCNDLNDAHDYAMKITRNANTNVRVYEGSDLICTVLRTKTVTSPGSVAKRTIWED